MKKRKNRQEQEFRETATNVAVLKNWWIFLQAVEAIRSDYDDKGAIFRLATALQSLIDQSLEFGEDRVREALPPEQRGLFVTILAYGQDLAATAIEEETLIFGEWEFPSARSVLLLLQELRRVEKNSDSHALNITLARLAEESELTRPQI